MNNEENYLQIKESSIPGIGEGLFTKKKIKKGEKICDFGGKLIEESVFNEMVENTNADTYNSESANYYISLTSGLVIDTYESDCFGRYANDAEGISKDSKFKNNAKIIEGEDEASAYLEATKTIPEGSEIFTSYGRSYWKSFLLSKTL